MKKLSFIIPCYCSENSVGGVIDEIIDTVERDGRYSYEIVCINDFSKDNTFAVLKQKATENKNIKVINFSRNFGQHSALMAGFNHATGDIIVCLDDDGQNPPSEMFKLIDKLEEGGYDLVSAKYHEKKRSLIRRLGTKISFWMSAHFIGKPKDIDLNSYYVFRSYILKELVKYKNAYPFVHGLILRITRNMANVVIEHKAREHGASGYSLKKLFSLWLNGFTAFSEKPLRMASMLGVACAFGGFAYGIFTIIRKIIKPSIPLGYSSIMTAILLLSGVIMLFLGLIGEYVGRIYISINNAPQYAIKETVNLSSDEERHPEEE